MTHGSGADVGGPGSGDAWTTDGEGGMDPRAAAALLDQVTRQARRGFAFGSPLLWLFRAVLALVAFGSFWLSVRDQHPYTGVPSGWALAVTFPLVAINIAWSALLIRRADTGVSGPAQRRRRSWLGGMLAVWVVAYVVTAPLYHPGASHPAWGLYPASAPLMIIGVVGAVTAPVRRDWPVAGVCLALAIVGAVAGFGGPAGAWLIMGIGLSAAMLGAGAYSVWQVRRSVVGP
jgi:hypothetical protein